MHDTHRTQGSKRRPVMVARLCYAEYNQVSPQKKQKGGFKCRHPKQTNASQFAVVLISCFCLLFWSHEKRQIERQKNRVLPVLRHDGDARWLIAIRRCASNGKNKSFGRVWFFTAIKPDYTCSPSSTLHCHHLSRTAAGDSPHPPSHNDFVRGQAPFFDCGTCSVGFRASFNWNWSHFRCAWKGHVREWGERKQRMAMDSCVSIAAPINSRPQYGNEMVRNGKGSNFACEGKIEIYFECGWLMVGHA